MGRNEHRKNFSRNEILIKMQVKELLNHIDSFAPFSLSEEWDNTGLIVGSYEAEVSRVGICLDAVKDAVIEAEKNKCEVLLCHHPLIFRALKKIDINSQTGAVIYEAIKHNITIIAAHTNWDKAECGVNAVLADLIGLNDVVFMENFGVSGTLHSKIRLKNFLEHVKNSWELSTLNFYSQDKNLDDEISRVALCGGSGAEFWRAAKNSGADIYITADMKYHELIDATLSGMSIASVNHGEMERASLPALSKKISECGLETILLNVKALSSPLKI